MTKITLKEWAALAEIIGTAGVIVSLLFVALSVNRNTQLVESAHSTLMFELVASSGDEQIDDGDYAAYSAKRSFGLDLRDPNEAKYFYGLLRQLSHWELLISRHSDGLVTDDVYSSWSAYYKHMIPRDMDIEWWDAVKGDYGPELATVVDTAYAEK